MLLHPILIIPAKPITPVIISDPTDLVDGQSVKFTCTSRANPRPQLRFLLGGVVAPASNSTPPTTSDEGLLKQGSQVWDTILTEDDNGKELKCEVVDHLYTQEEVSKTITLDVFCKSISQNNCCASKPIILAECPFQSRNLRA